MKQTSNLQRQDRITVLADGEEVTVFNWVNVQRGATVRGTNPIVQYHEPSIAAGDSHHSPEAVTHWIAAELRNEFNIDVSDHGISVIDPTDEEVTVL
jgi:hypothetical protein